MRDCYRVRKPPLRYDNSPMLLGPQLKPCVREAGVVKTYKQAHKKKRLKGKGPNCSVRLWLDEPRLMFGRTHGVCESLEYNGQACDFTDFTSDEGKPCSHWL